MRGAGLVWVRSLGSGWASRESCGFLRVGRDDSSVTQELLLCRGGIASDMSRDVLVPVVVSSCLGVSSVRRDRLGSCSPRNHSLLLTFEESGRVILGRRLMSSLREYRMWHGDVINSGAALRERAVVGRVRCTTIASDDRH